MLGIRQNTFEDNQFFLDDFYSMLLKGCSVSGMNCGEFRCGPFLLSQLKMKEDRRGIGVGLIIARPVEDAEGFCEEVTLHKVTLSAFNIGDRVEDGISLCRLIMEFERHIP